MYLSSRHSRLTVTFVPVPTIRLGRSDSLGLAHLPLVTPEPAYREPRPEENLPVGQVLPFGQVP